MLKVKLFIACIGVLVLTACSSTPDVTYTQAGQEYFISKPMKYSANVEVTIHSADEAKAIKAGYMSNEKAKEYVTKKVQEYLQKYDLLGDDGVKVNMVLNIDRGYSWEAFGGDSSMAVFEYTATVSLEKEGKKLASFDDSGTLQDHSIAGDFKAMFGGNDASSETKYFDAALFNYILAKLPREYTASDN